MSEDDICWDESGFSAGAGAPKAKPATDAESVKAMDTSDLLNAITEQRNAVANQAAKGVAQ